MFLFYPLTKAKLEEIRLALRKESQAVKAEENGSKPVAASETKIAEA